MEISLAHFEFPDDTVSYNGPRPSNAEEALRISVFKWAFVYRLCQLDPEDQPYGYVDGGSNTCGLCMLFINDDCKECPISMYTGERSCDGSYYQDYTHYVEDYKDEHNYTSPPLGERIHYVLAEYRFLQALYLRDYQVLLDPLEEGLSPEDLPEL